MGGSSAAVGVVGGVPGGAHQATVTTVDQTQIITLQVLFFHFIFVFCFSCLFLFGFFWGFFFNFYPFVVSTKPVDF